MYKPQSTRGAGLCLCGGCGQWTSGCETLCVCFVKASDGMGCLGMGWSGSFGLRASLNPWSLSRVMGMVSNVLPLVIGILQTRNVSRVAPCRSLFAGIAHRVDKPSPEYSVSHLFCIGIVQLWRGPYPRSRSRNVD